MKIAIASKGKDENSEVSEITGRAPYYLISEDKKITKVIKNPFAVGGGGAGFSVAKMLEDEKVELVIGGHFGSNMENALNSAGIKIKEISDKTIKQII
ncbi:hypothetical protein K8R33_05015 [archaeon]|nr:hypothetical protein [archaeon]